MTIFIYSGNTLRDCVEKPCSVRNKNIGSKKKQKTFSLRSCRKTCSVRNKILVVKKKKKTFSLRSCRKTCSVRNKILVAKKYSTKDICPVGTTHRFYLFLIFFFEIIKIRIIFGNQTIVNRENRTNWQFKL